MDSEKRTEVLHDLEMRYRHTIHEGDLIIKDEEARRLKVRNLILRDEASGLKEQLAQRDARIKELLDQVDDARSQLQNAQDKSRRQDKLMLTQSREIANLKEELAAFSAVSQDSAKILSQKLALSREVAVLKPELEHLRSQLEHQKDVLAEKLALERQLNALEVELANEKRVAQKVADRQEREKQAADQAVEELRKQVRDLEKEVEKGKRTAENHLKMLEEQNSEAEELQSLREQLATAEKNLAAEKHKAEQLVKKQASATSEMQKEMEQLRRNLEEAEKPLEAEKRAEQRQAKGQTAEASAAEEDLARLREELAEARKALSEEKKAQEKLRKENEQAQLDAEERQQAMADKVDRLRSKFREAQEELKRCRAELEKAQERTVKMPSVLTTTVPLKNAGVKANAKKRSADEMSMEDKVLSTPGNMDDRPKRPLKKRGFDLSMVGGKSEFSITPFLNKTLNPDDPASKPAGDDGTPSAAPVQFRGAEDATTPAPNESKPTAEEPAAEPSATKPAAAKLVEKEKKPRGRPRKIPLTDSSASKKNLTARNRKAPRIEPTLEKVAEEPDDDSTHQDQENRSISSTGSATRTASTSISTTTTTTTTVAAAEPKKKRRKLLGANSTTLFDADEDEVEKVKSAAVKRPAAKVGLGAGGMKAMGKAAGHQSLAHMQAQWTRTPFRLAVPVTGHLSSTRLAANSSTPLSFLPLLTHKQRPRPRISLSVLIPTVPARLSSSASSRWKLRQGSDHFARSARVQGLKSRAAFKLFELDSKYHLFRRGKGQVIVDLGFAPGSWSQVALDRTAPNGRVVGIDIIPAQPPRGVSTIQGNFLSPGVQGMVKQFLLEGEKRRLATKAAARKAEGKKGMEGEQGGGADKADEVADRPSYIEMERMAARESDAERPGPPPSPSPDEAGSDGEGEKPNLRLVDVVLSDMSAPWPQTHGFSVNSLSNPHIRMMNTSGIAFKDHAGSMDLCHAALSFASDTLKPGGHFVCKFYQGAEDKAFENLLKKMFARVHREKPESSRSESREAFFVALKRKRDVTLGDIEGQ
ncbi:hypothetical protein C8A03DRAFT_42483 [Achaetomium macrosporum]|uniref:rRNA methyltransferase 2, mitochondrial n=1 Tax=Achaetomium macrosporum TaxID=79813 RepID=A0AAN7H8F3_9PEZI|nr:hypothetical protein C8A03DRAFT_42483 [Achaetomium macrosporum]